MTIDIIKEYKRSSPGNIRATSFSVIKKEFLHYFLATV